TLDLRLRLTARRLLAPRRERSDGLVPGIPSPNERLRVLAPPLDVLAVAEQAVDQLRETLLVCRIEGPATAVARDRIRQLIVIVVNHRQPRPHVGDGARWEGELPLGVLRHQVDRRAAL